MNNKKKDGSGVALALIIGTAATLGIVGFVSSQLESLEFFKAFFPKSEDDEPEGGGDE